MVWTRSRFFRAGVSLALAGAAALTAAERTADPPPGEAEVKSSSTGVAKDKESAERLREGTVITNQLGTFRVTGDRVAFYPREGGNSYRLLENLTLERVSAILSTSREDRLWTISATVTEFRGSNYLLLKSAMVKSRPSSDDGR